MAAASGSASSGAAPNGGMPHPAAVGADTAAAPSGSAPPPNAGTAASARPVTLAFAGDIAFSLMVGHWVKKRDAGQRVPEGIDADYPFSHVKDTLSKPDLLIGNLECVVSDKGQKSTDHNAFRAPLSTPRLLKAAGFDIVSVANNHARDFGQAGFMDMLGRLKEAQLPYIGAQSYAPKPADLLVREIAGVRIGLLSYYIITSTLDRAQKDIRAARDQVDVLVLFNHWGLEGHQEPANGQEKWGPALIEAGADVVVGTHAHVLQPEQWIDRGTGRKRYIFYGLGNFVFTGQGFDALHATGGYLEIDLDKQGVVARRFRRIRLDDQGAPRFIDEAPIEPCSVIPYCPWPPAPRSSNR